MRKMIVCGDSHMSPVIRFPGTHFSEIIAESLGYELIPYSRGGMSNGGIAIQVDTAIQNKADFILVGTTYADRIEFPIDTPVPRKQFTIEDIFYSHKESVSSNHPWLNKNPNMISTNIVGIVDNVNPRAFARCSDPVEKEQAIKDWFRYLYYPDWKTQVDKWMMYAVLHKLHLSGIPHVICRDPINVIPTCPWLTIDLIEALKEFLVVDPPKRDPGYHTNALQQRQAAEVILNHIREMPNV